MEAQCQNIANTLKWRIIKIIKLLEIIFSVFFSATANNTATSSIDNNTDDGTQICNVSPLTE